MLDITPTIMHTMTEGIEALQERAHVITHSASASFKDSDAREILREFMR